MNALEIKNLSKSLSGFYLDNLNLTLPSGCVMGLIGENGAGKSTTIKLILGMLRKDSGTITILGDEKNISLIKEDIGVVMDEIGIPECLTAKQIGRVMKYTFRNWDAGEYARILQKLSLPDDKPFKDFSRGMKTKLGIAIAMSHHAKLLLLDEPTSGLDPVVRDEIIEMLYDFTRDEEHSILISSHIVSDLERLCDYVAFLHNGKLLLCEEKDILLSEYCIVYCPSERVSEFGNIKYKKETPYGTEIMMSRRDVPDGFKISPISIEELFVFMAKEAR